MALSIVTNTASLTAQRNLAGTQKSMAANLGRLSSGLRINSASDDAAGLAISERLRAQVRGLAQAERNAMDGISLTQTAEGAMNEVSGILTRMRELSVQSANGTVGASERQFLQDEFSALRDEIDRIANVTEFNGTNLLDGSSATVTMQVGINDSADDRIDVALTDVHANQLGTTTTLDLIDISTVAGAQTAMTVVDESIDDISTGRASLGATQNRLQVTVTNLSSVRENLSAANSRIRDVDVASETAAMTRNNILMQAGVSILAQANQAPSIALSLLG